VAEPSREPSKEPLKRYIETMLQAGAKARALLAEIGGAAIEEAVQRVCTAFRAGGKLLIFGNGGSAADAQHMAAEFVGRFQRERDGLPAIALTADSSVLTSLGNDFGMAAVFAKQVQALGRAGDLAVGISTSGESPNVVEGLKAARAAGMATMLLGGGTGGKAAAFADVTLLAPTREVWQIQECHVAMIHVICGAVEQVLSRELET